MGRPNEPPLASEPEAPAFTRLRNLLLRWFVPERLL
jgi:hypothetical protein